MRNHNDENEAHRAGSYPDLQRMGANRFSATALHETLQALHAQADVSAVNPGGGPLLTVAKHQLRDWIESQFGPVEQEGDETTQVRAAAGLRFDVRAEEGNHAFRTTWTWDPRRSKKSVVASTILCKQLLFYLASELRRPGESRAVVNRVGSPLRNKSCSFLMPPSVRWESGNPVFGFPLSRRTPFLPLPLRLERKSSSRRRRCGNVGISPGLRDFQGGVEMVGSVLFAFHHFHPPAFPQRSVYSALIYISSPFGTRSPGRIAKRCKAAFQFCTGIVHFLAMCSSARYSSLRAAS